MEKETSGCFPFTPEKVLLGLVTSKFALYWMPDTTQGMLHTAFYSIFSTHPKANDNSPERGSRLSKVTQQVGPRVGTSFICRLLTAQWGRMGAGQLSQPDYPLFQSPRLPQQPARGSGGEMRCVTSTRWEIICTSTSQIRKLRPSKRFFSQGHEAMRGIDLAGTTGLPELTGRKLF